GSCGASYHLFLMMPGGRGTRRETKSVSWRRLPTGWPGFRAGRDAGTTKFVAARFERAGPGSFDGTLKTCRHKSAGLQKHASGERDARRRHAVSHSGSGCFLACRSVSLSIFSETALLEPSSTQDGSGDPSHVDSRQFLTSILLALRRRL